MTYDARRIFNLLSSNITNAIRRLRKNFGIQSGSPPRHITTKYIRIQVEEWKRTNNYGRRLIVELYMLKTKRAMGEIIMQVIINVKYRTYY
jgi:hypothetical protein